MDIKSLKGVGEKTSLYLENLGITEIKDIVCFYPKSYEDFTSYTSISLAKDRKNACIKVKIISDVSFSKTNSGKFLYRLTATDGFEDIQIVFFNRKYEAEKLKFGNFYLLMGNVTCNFGKYQILSPKIKESIKGGIFPIYHKCKGITSNKILSIVKSAFDVFFENEYKDTFSLDFLKENELCPLDFALRNIHFPKDKESLKKARRRIIFENFFWYYLKMRSLKNKARKKTNVIIKDSFISEFKKNLPFELTLCQEQVILQCINDMKNLSMNRLLQGDVGSGKTAVAAGIAYATFKNGYQVAFMAPTELLAYQHYKTLSEFFKNENIQIEFIFGAMKSKDKTRAYENISSGKSKIVVGTHSLISDKLIFNNLGFVVTDEQHRFGVNQRGKLISKGKAAHVLVMSATPIPRSLAMILYADLDISILKGVLPGRQKIDTFHVASDKRERMYGFLKKIISKGEQAYIVCATIEEMEENNNILDIFSCKKLLLQHGFKNEDIEILHGKMSSIEKEEVMKKFVLGKVKILVSTTIIEVGIDVKNASIIIIENAERFGISQLHQLRGRVGRGDKKSYCILVSDSKSKESLKRLQALTKSSDGMYLSYEDLKIRGPGDFFGVNQHGVPNVKISTNYEDMQTIKQAKDIANEISKDKSILKSEKFKKINEKLNAINNNENLILGDCEIIF